MFVRIDINILQILFLHVNIISKKILFAKSCIIRKIYKNIYSYFKNLFFLFFSLFLFHKKFLSRLIPYRYRFETLLYFKFSSSLSLKCQINVLSWNTTEIKKRTINQIIKESITWIIELATDIPLGAVFK